MKNPNQTMKTTLTQNLIATAIYFLRKGRLYLDLEYDAGKTNSGGGKIQSRTN